MVAAIHHITLTSKPARNSIRQATKEIRKNWTSGERLYRVLQAQRLQQQLWETLGVFDTVEC
jgi:hypothetical protein